MVHAMQAAGRPADAVELWQVAALDCNEDGIGRSKIGVTPAFLVGYVIDDRDLDERGVLSRHHEQLLELRWRYSTRPGDVDAKLVVDLSLANIWRGASR